MPAPSDELLSPPLLGDLQQPRVAERNDLIHQRLRQRLHLIEQRARVLFQDPQLAYPLLEILEAKVLVVHVDRNVSVDLRSDGEAHVRARPLPRNGLRVHWNTVILVWLQQRPYDILDQPLPQFLVGQLLHVLWHRKVDAEGVEALEALQADAESVEVVAVKVFPQSQLGCCLHVHPLDDHHRVQLG